MRTPNYTGNAQIGIASTVPNITEIDTQGANKPTLTERVFHATGFQTEITTFLPTEQARKLILLNKRIFGNQNLESVIKKRIEQNLDRFSLTHGMEYIGGRTDVVYANGEAHIDYIDGNGELHLPEKGLIIGNTKFDGKVKLKGNFKKDIFEGSIEFPNGDKYVGKMRIWCAQYVTAWDGFQYKDYRFGKELGLTYAPSSEGQYISKEGKTTHCEISKEGLFKEGIFYGGTCWRDKQEYVRGKGFRFANAKYDFGIFHKAEYRHFMPNGEADLNLFSFSGYSSSLFVYNKKNFYLRDATFKGSIDSASNQIVGELRAKDLFKKNLYWKGSFNEGFYPKDAQAFCYNKFNQAWMESEFVGGEYARERKITDENLINRLESGNFDFD